MQRRLLICTRKGNAKDGGKLLSAVVCDTLPCTAAGNEDPDGSGEGQSRPQGQPFAVSPSAPPSQACSDTWRCAHGNQHRTCRSRPPSSCWVAGGVLHSTVGGAYRPAHATTGQSGIKACITWTLWTPWPHDDVYDCCLLPMAGPHIANSVQMACVGSPHCDTLVRVLVHKMCDGCFPAQDLSE